MTSEQPSAELPPDLRVQIQRYLDGEIDGAEFSRLEALMVAEPSARRFYRSYVGMDANLREVAEEPEEENLVALGNGGGRSLAASLLQAVATFILGAAAVYFIIDRSVPPAEPISAAVPVSPAASALIDNGLATLTQAVGVEWAADATNYQVGAVLPDDVLHLKKGLLQIEFFSGAIVILEGPAKFELIDPMRAICHFGKTRANVPESASGFTIASAYMDVVDLGTEFALVVDENGLGEVHVFEGSVEIHQKPSGEMHQVSSGNGVRFNDGNLEFLPLNEMGFVDAQHISVLANAEADEHMALWKEYSEELKAHPDVLLYYSFDEKGDWSRELRNVRKMSADPLHGAIVGCRWSEGRWNGKGSLEFKGSGDRVRIQIPGIHDEFSLMAWVRIDGFDRDFNSLMLSDNWVPGGVHWQFSRAGQLILGTKREKAHGHFQSDAVLNQSHLGDWIQLGVSYNSMTKHVAHYLNGRVVWEGKMQHHIPISVPRGELGNWKTDYKQTGHDIRNLNGRMDEFVFFSRALSKSEMRDLYERGKPHS